jgi:hypothetical protein
LPDAPFQKIETLGEMLCAGKLWHRCESIVSLILDISCCEGFEQPVKYVFDSTYEEQMKFISLPKPIDIVEWVMPDCVAHWMVTKSVSSINVYVLPQLLAYMQVSCLIQWLKI